MGGISWNTDDANLKEYFTQYGEVEDARIMRVSCFSQKDLTSRRKVEQCYRRQTVEIIEVSVLSRWHRNQLQSPCAAKDLS